MLERTGPLTRRRFVAALGVGAGAAGAAPMFLNGRRRSTPAIVGHRGAAGLEPPNTIAGIRRALEYDVDGVELDVRRTADGELVLFHDPILDLTTDASGLLRNRTLAELRDVRVEGEEPIPTLREGLTVLQSIDVDVFLELKKAGYGDAVLEVVQEFGLLDRTTLVSLEVDALRPMVDAPVDLGLVGSVPNPELIDDAVELDVVVVMCHYAPQGIEWLVEEATRHAMDAGVWSLVATETNLRDVLSYDVDVLTTNRPDVAREFLRE